MTRIVLSAAVAAVALMSGAAFAGDLCNAPKADWQQPEALQQKLEGDGWKVVRVKTEDGCYEVYATDHSGKRVEAYFDPQSFEMVKSKSEG